MQSDVQNSFSNIKAGGGYKELSQYPSQPGMNLHFVDFPGFVKDGEIEVLAADQAHMFVGNPKGNTDPAKMVLDTSQLEKLLRNIYDNNSHFTMGMDADVLRNPDRFVEKYNSLRGEPEAETKKALLKREAQLIGDFVKSGGITILAKKAIASSLADKGQAADVDQEAARFLQENFKLLGVATEQPLAAATWSVKGPEGTLLAKQTYSPNMHNTERPWQIGSEAELLAMKQAGNNANNILDAVAGMRQMPVTNITLGRNLDGPAQKGPCLS